MTRKDMQIDTGKWKAISQAVGSEDHDPYATLRAALAQKAKAEKWDRFYSHWKGVFIQIVALLTDQDFDDAMSRRIKKR